jgi:peptidoglycan/LPS O-acetylase OafA/YrhL
MKEQRKKRLKQLAFWTVVWTLTMALATFGPKFMWDNNTIATLIAVLVNLAIGIRMILANRNVVNNGDELEKKIQLESMGLTLGLAVVVGLFYSLLDQTNLISGDAEISNLVIFIGLTYIISTFYNNKRYK